MSGPAQWFPVAGNSALPVLLRFGDLRQFERTVRNEYSAGDFVINGWVNTMESANTSDEFNGGSWPSS